MLSDLRKKRQWLARDDETWGEHPFYLAQEEIHFERMQVLVWIKYYKT